MLAFDQNVAGRRYFGFEHRILSEAAHQHAGAAIDETLRETVMQRIGYAVLYPTRDALPMLGVVEPARMVGDEAPGSHLRETVGQRRDVAVHAIRDGDLARHPIVGNLPAPHDKTEDRQRQFGVRGRRGLAIVGNLAGFPKARDIGRSFCIASNVVVAPGGF